MIEHDCPTCQKLIDMFGTCEYMHQANTGGCTCKFYFTKNKKTRQLPLQTDSTDRARIAYWMKWLRNQPWVLERDAQTAPNLPKTGDARIEDFDQKDDTTEG